jgi:glutathione S-transferase
MGVPVLWHIEVSHFNEKVRWALDYKGVEHRRRAPMPGILHPLVALAKTRNVTFPILDIDGETIGDSTRIIAELERRFPEPPLYPVDPEERRRALEIEDFFDEEVAPNVRRYAFYELSQDPDRAGDGLRMLGLPMLPGPLAAAGVRVVAKRYGGDSESSAPARAATKRGCERILEELGPSGYLVGDSFSVADLTAASILFPLARPAEYQYVLPEWPDSVGEFVATLPEPALEWVRRMWREHRGQSVEMGVRPRYTS